MGGKDSSLWLRSSLFKGTSSVKLPSGVSNIQGRFGAFRSLGSGREGFVKEGGYRASSRQPGRILCPHFPRAQGNRGLETDLRLIGSQSLPSGDSFPHGDGVVNLGVDGRGRVDGVLGFKGCVFPSSHSSPVAQIHEVCLAGNNLPISSPVLRPCHRSSGLHQGDGSGVCLGSSTWHSVAPLSGRLADFRPLRGVLHREYQGSSTAVFSSGDSGQLRQVRPEPQPEKAVFGYGSRYSGSPGIPISRSRQSFPGGGSTVFNRQSPTSFPLEVVAGSSGFLSEVGSRRASADASSSMVPEEELEGGFGSRLVEGGSDSSVPEGSSLVVGSGESSEGFSFRDGSSRTDTVFRCFPTRVGSSFGGFSGFRGVEPEGKGTSHQPVRTSSSLSRDTGLSARAGGFSSVGDVGQLHSGSLPQEFRRYPFRVPVNFSGGSSQVVREPFNLPSSQVYTRAAQCDSRRSQSEVCGVRVDPPSGGLREDLPGVGLSSSGSFCHRSDSTSATVCVTSTGSGSMETGCVLLPVDGPGSVRLSPLRSDPSCSGESSGDTVCEGDTGGTSVATGRLVSTVARSVSGQSKRTTTVDFPAPPASSSPLPQSSGGASTSRVETLQRLFRARGFSRKAALFMSQPVRQSSSSVYQAKWKVYCGWCESRGLDPCSAPVVKLADFFLFLRNTKRLSISAIRGYRSALAPVLRQSGVDLTTDKDLAALLRSFAVSCPPRSSRLPAWDLSLVLRSLLRAPYEPLRTASTRDVSLKAVFLLALATARRVSELHGLSAEVRHSRGWTSMTFSLAPDFVAKTQLPGQVSLDEITIPALTEFVGEQEEESLLCPVRAVREYLRRTRDCRPSCSRLFVTVTEPRRSVHPHTLSVWICQVIRRAYDRVSEEESRLVKVNSHEVRAVATSVLFRKVKNLALILKAGTWKCTTTFASFYLRDVAHRYLDTFSLGPIVSALRVVH